MICKKSFSMAHITKELTADAVSFVATEVPKVFDGIQDIHYIWTSPFEAAAILLLLWTKVGIWVLPGKLQSLLLRLSQRCSWFPRAYLVRWKYPVSEVVELYMTVAFKPASLSCLRNC